MPPHSPCCLLRFFTRCRSGRQRKYCDYLASFSQMEMQMDFQLHFLRPEFAGSNSSLREKDDHKKNKENIPPFSSYSSASVLPLPHLRNPLHDITRLIASATHHVRYSASVAEARAHMRLGLRSSSKKCSKKKAASHLVGVVSSEKSHQRHEMPILRKSFR